MAVLYGTQSDGSLIPVQADAQGRLVAELAGVDQAVQGDLLVTGNVQMLSLNGGQLAGFRNWIINGNFTVNQRAGTRTPGVGVYGFDRWKGHASGLEQVVEALPAGEYTLSWSGGGNGSFGGITAAAPITATVAGGDTSVIVPSDATLVQLEPGPVATPFEHRPIGIELALCQRYFFVTQSRYFCSQNCSNTVSDSNKYGFVNIPLPVTMRVNPTVDAASVSPNSAINAVVRRSEKDVIVVTMEATATQPANTAGLNAGLAADAEL